MKTTTIIIALFLAIFNADAATLTVDNTTTTIAFDTHYDNIDIINGGVLIIQNCTVLIKQNKFIKVNVGCKLVIDNATIDVITGSGSVADFWGGVVVFGNNNSIQTPANQGIFEFKNNSTLKNALTSICIGNLKYTDLDDKINLADWWNNGGGIIKAEDSKIENCRYGAVFSPYYGSFLTRPNANLSYFKNVTFEWNNNAQGNLIRGTSLQNTYNKWGFRTLVELNEVHDISFIGCTFKNTKEYSQWWSDGDGTLFSEVGLCRGVGIRSNGSSFFVRNGGNCYTGVNCTHCIGQKNTFEGLSIGIYLDGYLQPNTALPANNLATHVDITGAVFLNNFYSVMSYTPRNIVISNLTDNDRVNNPISNVFINRCNFLATGEYYKYNYFYHPNFVKLNQTENIEISDNSFEWNSINLAQKRDWSRGGISKSCHIADVNAVELENCNTSPNYIYKNELKLLDVSYEACYRYFNFIYIYENVGSNAEITCNIFNSAFSATNYEVSDLVINSLLSDQGSTSFDAANTWSYCIARQANIKTNFVSTQPDFHYYYYPGSQKEPTIIGELLNNTFTGKVITHNTSATANTCTASSYCKFYTVPVLATEGGGEAGNGGDISDAPPAGTNEIVLDFNPNPVVSNLVTFSVSYTLGGNPSGVIFIYNTSGQVVGTLIVDNAQVGLYTFDMSNLPPGIYYKRISTMMEEWLPKYS